MKRTTARIRKREAEKKNPSLHIANSWSNIKDPMLLMSEIGGGKMGKREWRARILIFSEGGGRRVYFGGWVAQTAPPRFPFPRSNPPKILPRVRESADSRMV